LESSYWQSGKAAAEAIRASRSSAIDGGAIKGAPTPFSARVDGKRRDGHGKGAHTHARALLCIRRLTSSSGAEEEWRKSKFAHLGWVLSFERGAQRRASGTNGDLRRTDVRARENGPSPRDECAKPGVGEEAEETCARRKPPGERSSFAKMLEWKKKKSSPSFEENAFGKRREK